MGYKSETSAAEVADTWDTPTGLHASQTTWPPSTSKKPPVAEHSKRKTPSVPTARAKASMFSDACRVDSMSDVSFVPHSTNASYHKDYPAHYFIEVQANHKSSEASILAMMLASTVLKETLQVNLAGQRGEKVKLQLEGSEKAVTIFLAILHYHFAQVPAILNLSELFEVACLIAKYRCAHIFQPWAVAWVAACKSDVSNAESHKALWIAYTFGDEAWYKEMLKALILQAKCQEDYGMDEKKAERPGLCNEEGIKLTDMILPDLILEIITETRNIHIIGILEAVVTPFKQASAEPRDPHHKFCRVNKGQEQCEDLLVGSAFRQLARHGLMPVPNAENYPGSIQCLTNQVKSLKLNRLVVQGEAPHQSHEGCSLGLTPVIDHILADLPIALTDEHQEHIRLQGIATGLAASSEGIDVKPLTETTELKRRTRWDIWINKSGTSSIASSFGDGVVM